MNNVDLHLIKGRPAVHADDDLIVGHIAIVVSDVGASLSFYTDVVGMKQIMRPNFDR